jgi:hypothetical protein
MSEIQNMINQFGYSIHAIFVVNGGSPPWNLQT